MEQLQRVSNLRLESITEDAGELIHHYIPALPPRPAIAEIADVQEQDLVLPWSDFLSSFGSYRSTALGRLIRSAAPAAFGENFSRPPGSLRPPQKH